MARDGDDNSDGAALYSRGTRLYNNVNVVYVARTFDCVKITSLFQRY